MKYRRLLKMVLTFGLFSAACGFVLGHLLTYGFATEGLTKEVLVTRGLESLAKGMFIGGFCISFPMWLVLEKFRRPEKGT